MKTFKNISISNKQLFFGILIIISLVYNYNKTLFFKPIGIHQWRNSVSAAIALNGCMENAFINTKINALLADNNTSDITIIEFPIIYNVVAILYKVFGTHEFIFRLVNILIGFLGLFALFKTTLFFLKDRFYAIILPLIVFSSPIYVFYLNNFIPDAAALSIVFIGIYFFFKHSYNNNPSDWYFSMLFLALAGLIKTASLIFYFALGFLMLLAIITRKKEAFKIIPTETKYIISYLSVLIVIIAWYAYAKVYSGIHEGSVSAVEIRPIWRLSAESIRDTYNSMRRWYIGGIYHSSKLLVFSIILFIVNLVLIKKYNRILSFFTVLSVLGAISFTFVFFRSMRQHDYYQINNIIILVFIFLSFFVMLRQNYPRIFNSYITKTVLGIILILLINDCRNIISKRYSTKDWHYVWSSKNIKMFGNLTPALRELGVARTDVVYCSPDPSFNISLYLMDQKGFTDFGGLQGRSFSEKFEEMKSSGLQYVVIGDTAEFARRNEVEFYRVNLGTKIMELGDTQVFKVE